jgi:hypothetical protein
MSKRMHITRFLYPEIHNMSFCAFDKCIRSWIRSGESVYEVFKVLYIKGPVNATVNFRRESREIRARLALGLTVRY